MVCSAGKKQQPVIDECEKMEVNLRYKSIKRLNDLRYVLFGRNVFQIFGCEMLENGKIASATYSYYIRKRSIWLHMHRLSSQYPIRKVSNADERQNLAILTHHARGRTEVYK